MKNISILFLVFITACSSTKIIKYSALPKIVEGEGILIKGIKNLNQIRGHHLFEFAKNTLSGTNKVIFLPEQEYFLLQKGINKEYLYGDQTSDSIRSIIAEQTNCRYILSIEVLNSQKGGTFGSYTSLELDRYNSHYYEDNETNNANLIFKILDTKGNFTKNEFQITTKINPLIINEGDGETRINATTEFSAITKAFEKGIRQLKKGVVKKQYQNPSRQQ